MSVKIIPCLKDNYAYLIEIPENKNSYILIDAPDFQTIDQYLMDHNIKIDFILSTHHHWDHIGGNLELKEKYNCRIYGSKKDSDRIPGIDVTLSDNEIFKIGNLEIKAMLVPGHTSHHMIYYFKELSALFTGDTLFSMGCGRLFEGSYEEMFSSLQKIKSLPDDTQIYCGHEYSEKNAKFAMSVDDKNSHLKERFDEILVLRTDNKPTVPTTLDLEKKINPFLRASTVDEFAKLRQLRDTF